MPSLGNGSGSQNPSEKKLSGSQAIGACEHIKRLERSASPKTKSLKQIIKVLTGELTSRIDVSSYSLI